VVRFRWVVAPALRVPATAGPRGPATRWRCRRGFEWLRTGFPGPGPGGTGRRWPSPRHRRCGPGVRGDDRGAFLHLVAVQAHRLVVRPVAGVERGLVFIGVHHEGGCSSSWDLARGMTISPGHRVPRISPAPDSRQGSGHQPRRAAEVRFLHPTGSVSRRRKPARVENTHPPIARGWSPKAPHQREGAPWLATATMPVAAGGDPTIHGLQKTMSTSRGRRAQPDAQTI
jgi:hypothetical protein